MKEATGELNMTVIVAISVGILSAFFFGVLWPMINSNFSRNASCKSAVCDCTNRDKNNRCLCAPTKDKLYNNNYNFRCPFGG